MRIILDMDDVLADFSKAFLGLWNDWKGVNLSTDDVNIWDIEKTLGPEGAELMNRCFIDGYQFFGNLPPIKGAVDGVETLIQQQHDVLIATALPRVSHGVVDGKRLWLKRHMPFFPLDNLITTSRKYLLNADVIVDDGAHNLVDWANRKHGAIAFDRPWNRNLPATQYPVVRAATWWLNHEPYPSLIATIATTEDTLRERRAA